MPYTSSQAAKSSLQARSDAKALLLDPEQNPNFENLAARAEEAKTNKIISENRGRGLINDD